MYGWTGTILRVDLTEGKIVKEKTPEDLAINFLGGEGFGVKWLYDEVAPGTSPFDPKMIFVVGIGPLNGTLCPSSGRLELITKSPLTGILGDCNAGGSFAPELKFAGYDSLIVQGKAKRPVYLWIDDDEVEIRDASHLWGMKDKYEFSKRLKEEIGDPNVQIMDIGIAGENKVAYAAVFVNLSRAAASTGIGSVMGSKNLKAIAVRGTKGVEVADPEGFKKAAKECTEKLRSSIGFQAHAEGGTIGLLQDSFKQVGLINSMYNYQKTWMSQKEFEPISGANWVKKFKEKNKSCFGCPTGCSIFARVKEGPYAGTTLEGNEYYHMYTLQGLGISDPSFTIKWGRLANELGCDVGNLFHIICFCCELYQRGIITKKDTDGLDLTWGNQEAFLALMEKIALRDGFGDILADGFLEAAKRIGKKAESYLIVIKGRPICMDLRFGVANMLSHVTSTRGGDHLKGTLNSEFVEGMIPELDKEMAKKFFGASTMHPDSSEAKDKMVQWMENFAAVADSIGTCQGNSVWATLGKLGFEDYAKLLATITGVEYDAKRLMEVGERIYRLEMAYNAREGNRRNDFKIPRRFVEEPMPSGPLKGKVADQKLLDKLLDSYFQLRGFDPRTGLPTRKGLEDVGLKYVADDLEKRNLLAKQGGEEGKEKRDCS